MCLYPKLIFNPKYKANKKNAGHVPAFSDKRVLYVPVGCGICLECRKQRSRNWQLRLLEDIKHNTNGHFITLTFSTESLKNIYESNDYLHNLEGYKLDNEICKRGVRLFLERWRKQYGKSLRHWLVSELGHTGTEHIHLHGIIWSDDASKLAEIWQYGFVWDGYLKGKTYVNAKTVNYIVKYLTKVDTKHMAYKPVTLTSPGIGKDYINTRNAFNNKFNGSNTSETYQNEQGYKIALPKYWRNKIYTEEEREKLWIQLLDKNERFICGEKVKADNLEEYNDLLKFHRRRTQQLGYPPPEYIMSKTEYETHQRNIIHQTRINKDIGKQQPK